MMSDFKFNISSNAQDWVKYLNTVAEKTQLDIEGKMPSLKQGTKRTVQRELKPNFGVDEGIYRKSFRINSFAESKWHIGFQVFARKPHYRLTHLLEYGHRKKVFRWGQGKRTKWGNVGMVFLSGMTKEIPHIEVGQEYAEEKVYALYQKAIEKNLERMKK